MIILRTTAEMRNFRETLPSARSIGFVPTMGALHAGHESLIRMAQKESDISVVSIFVNPQQFAQGEDLSTYPRTEEEDIGMCRQAGIDVVFCPSAEEIFPESFGTFVTTACGQPGRNAAAEGASRPTFFRGVATVLTKLFILIRPHKVFFGQKDAQQCAVVNQLVNDMGMSIEVIIAPTMREPDGLAMSSRNEYLTARERGHAPILYRGLIAAQEAVARGQHKAGALRELVKKFVESEMTGVPQVQFELKYVSVCDRFTMIEVKGDIQKGMSVMCIAAMLGKTRLIDNMILDGSA